MRRAQDVISARAEQTLVLVHLATGQHYTLDGAGVRVWDLCDGSRTALEISTALSEEFDGPPDDVRSDVLELLAELTADNLLIATV